MDRRRRNDGMGMLLAKGLLRMFGCVFGCCRLIAN